MNHYPHHIGDFDKATRHLSRVERSIYRDLIELYYDTEQQLTLDRTALCRLVLARSNEETTAVEQTLNEFFNETPTGWYHSRCELEIEKYRANASQKSLAGKASAAAKTLKAQQALNGRTTDAEQANNGASTNRKPLTVNQEPRTIKPKSKAIAPSALFVLPDWIDKTQWDLWIKSRKKKMIPEQMQAYIDKLAGWRSEGLDHCGALANSALNGYTGLFLPDVKKGNGSAEPPWWSSNESMLAKGEELGLFPKSGEGWPDFKGRLQVRISSQ